MIRKLLLLFLPALLTSTTAHACTCVPSGNFFCQCLQNDPNIKSVVMVRKTSAYLHGMNVELVQQLGGETVPQNFIVWGDNGLLCRLYCDNWNVGDTIIMALHACDLAGNWDSTGAEQSSDYMISVCGVYFLNVIHGQVSGYITAQTEQTVPLAQFLADNCAHWVDVPTFPDFTCSIYPNPTSGLIYFTSSIPLEASYAIVDVTGRTVLTGTISGTTGQADLSPLAAGMYTVTFTTAGAQRSYRFIRKS